MAKTKTGHEKYPHIRSEQMNFGRDADWEMVDAFLDAEMEIHSASGDYDAQSWGENWDDHPGDGEIDMLFEDIGQSVPTVPSTILHACDKNNVYIWIVDNAKLTIFKKSLIKSLNDYIRTSGPWIVKEEITAAIKRGFKYGIERDDIVKIMNELIASEIMEG